MYVGWWYRVRFMLAAVDGETLDVFVNSES